MNTIRQTVIMNILSENPVVAAWYRHRAARTSASSHVCVFSYAVPLDARLTDVTCLCLNLEVILLIIEAWVRLFLRHRQRREHVFCMEMGPCPILLHNLYQENSVVEPWPCCHMRSDLLIVGVPTKEIPIWRRTISCTCVEMPAALFWGTQMCISKD